MAKSNLKIDIVAHDKATGVFGKVNKSLSGLKHSALSFKKAAMAIGGTYAVFSGIGAIFKTLTSNAKQSAVLQTITASSDEFRRSTEFIQRASKDFSFASDEITRSFVFLRKKGLDPLNTDILYRLGDAAAAMGVTLEQASNAVGHAMVGEFSYLKSLGIASRVQGNAVDFIYYDKNNQQHVRRVTNRYDTELIAGVLQEMFGSKFAGSMSRIQKSWAGIKNNVASTTSNALTLLTSHPVFDRILQSTLEFLKSANASIENGKMKTATKILGDFFEVIYEGASIFVGLLRTIYNSGVILFDKFRELVQSFKSSVSGTLIDKVFTGASGLINGFIDLTKYSGSRLWNEVTGGIKAIDEYSDIMSKGAAETQKAEIKVDIKNAPAGTGVTTNATGFNLETEMSYSNVMA